MSYTVILTPIMENEMIKVSLEHNGKDIFIHRVKTSDPDAIKQALDKADLLIAEGAE